MNSPLKTFSPDLVDFGGLAFTHETPRTFPPSLPRGQNLVHLRAQPRTVFEILESYKLLHRKLLLHHDIPNGWVNLFYHMHVDEIFSENVDKSNCKWVTLPHGHHASDRDYQAYVARKIT